MIFRCISDSYILQHKLFHFVKSPSSTLLIISKLFTKLHHHRPEYIMLSFDFVVSSVLLHNCLLVWIIFGPYLEIVAKLGFIFIKFIDVGNRWNVIDNTYNEDNWLRLRYICIYKFGSSKASSREYRLFIFIPVLVTFKRGMLTMLGLTLHRNDEKMLMPD